MSLSITKKFRQLWRSENAAGYLSVTEEGSEFLSLGADGSRTSYTYLGIDLDRAFGLVMTEPELLAPVPSAPPQSFPSPNLPSLSPNPCLSPYVTSSLSL